MSKRKSKAFDHSKYEHWIDPAAVIPYEGNAKEHTPKQIKNIANSIDRFGWQQDTVLTVDNVLVIGHGRRLAALEIGCEMPYHVIDKTADELTDKDIRELRIADNQTNAETGNDWAVLEAELEGLTFDGFDFDFSGVELYPAHLDESADIPDKTSEEVVVRIKFENAREWRKHEAVLRELVDNFQDVKISVGGGNENHSGDE